ncbi:hypothetical protein T8T21_00725 [Limimaricola variabilis]|uniref:hypothetical protein n=1 Tax=Limimaricola variabilis TaxID=1492771 RepID=UPI002AC92F91|nr:hypothetical protein [Limimaricola variabilis]WPY94682.1 hypothetical protein T8T21_00725 [Limimaricola variabilis]
MPPLTSDRSTPQQLGDLRVAGVAAATLIYQGAIVMRDAAGYATKGATAAGAVGIGRAETRADNSAGAAGDLDVTYQPGTFRFANSAAADAIAAADIGKLCFIVDDQTVAKTDGTATRSPAGIVEAVDALGVWVRFDEALTLAAV